MRNRVASQFTQRGDVGSVYGGVQVDSALGIQDALVSAGLDWAVAKRPVVMADKLRTPIPGFSATYRKDTNVPLGVVKTRYTPVQNSDAFAWLSEVIGTDGACITSAGALHGGRYTWVCVDLGGFDVLPEDSVRKHMLVMNSHDGSSNLLVQLLPHRIVCQNILNFSFGARMGGGGSDPFKVRHTDTAMIKMSEIQRVIGIANENFGEVQEAFKQFKETSVTPDQNQNIIYASLDVTPEDLELFASGEYDKQPQWVNHAELINQVIDTGPGNDIPGVRGTVWGTFNGINSYYDHVRTVRGAEVNPDNAIESKLMGHSAKMKTKAFEACYNSLAALKN